MCKGRSCSFFNILRNKHKTLIYKEEGEKEEKAEEEEAGDDEEEEEENEEEEEEKEEEEEEKRKEKENKSNRTTMRPLGIYRIGIYIYILDVIHILMNSGDLGVFFQNAKFCPILVIYNLPDDQHIQFCMNRKFDAILQPVI